MTLFIYLPEVTLKLNPANNTLNVSFLQVHASAVVMFLKVTLWATLLKLYTDAVRGIIRILHITIHAGLHAKT